jgi:hypothetical protein
MPSVPAGGVSVNRIISGVVKNGLIVPNSPLPERAQVEIRLSTSAPESAVGPRTGGMPPQKDAVPAGRLTPGELRKMPRGQRQAILAAAAERAEQDYRSDDAFQVKSVSESRFLDRLGELTPGQLDDIAKAIAVCVGAP